MHNLMGLHGFSLYCPVFRDTVHDGDSKIFDNLISCLLMTAYRNITFKYHDMVVKKITRIDNQTFSITFHAMRIQTMHIYSEFCSFRHSLCPTRSEERRVGKER